MQLSQEDSLRLNVLLNQALQAIRIDEGKMIVYGLTERGEAKIQLNPNCKDELYIRRIKETISSHILGSPGGYPVFLKRWTRMGQQRANNLESLLKLGEPEAVVAVVGAEGITDEIARRAWWAMPSADNARRMLARKEVAQGKMGKILADFLLEFLPFEEEPRNMVESVRLMLQPGLVDDETRDSLWSKGQRRNAYLVGFLHASPDHLPQSSVTSRELTEFETALRQLAEQDNVLARMLLRILGEQGQGFLKTTETVLNKPANQDVVVALFEAIEAYFRDIRPHNERRRDINQILSEASQYCAISESCCHKQAIDSIKSQLPAAVPLLESLFVLACVGEQLIAPIFATTDAVGSVMRRKIEPVTKPISQHIGLLLGKR
ncbi:MAG: DsrS [Gammaproteobacteria bacterium]|nr:DsrS [Gammaproteobacteria bacterium]